MTERTALTANAVRRLIAEEIAGIPTGTSHAYSHQVRGGGRVNSGGLNVNRVYGNMVPWIIRIEASDMYAQQKLAANFSVIKAKLEAAGFEVKPEFRWDYKTRQEDKTRLLLIYTDEEAR